MKKILILALGLLALGTFSEAQETWSVTAPSPDVALVDRARVDWNTSVCARFNLAASCTQAQACIAAGVTGGGSCTLPNARAADVEIFANTLAGREGFFIRKVLLRVRRELLGRERSELDGRQACINWRAGNDTVKNAMCAAAGAPVPATVALGCNLCPE